MQSRFDGHCARLWQTELFKLSEVLVWGLNQLCEIGGVGWKATWWWGFTHWLFLDDLGFHHQRIRAWWGWQVYWWLTNRHHFLGRLCSFNLLGWIFRVRNRCCAKLGWWLFGLCVVVVVIRYIVSSGVGVIISKHHFFKHLFQSDSTFSLLDHFGVHSIIVVIIFPTFLFSLKVELGLRLLLLFKLFYLWLSTFSTTTFWLLLLLGKLLNLQGGFWFDSSARVCFNLYLRTTFLINELGDVKLPMLNLLARLWFYDVNDPVDTRILDLKLFVIACDWLYRLKCLPIRLVTLWIHKL